MKRTSATSFPPLPNANKLLDELCAHASSLNLASAGAFRSMYAVPVTSNSIAIRVRNADKIFAKYGEHTNNLLYAEAGQWAFAIEQAAIARGFKTRIIYNGMHVLDKSLLELFEIRVGT